MKTKYKLYFLVLLLLLIFPMCYASWIYDACESTNNSLDYSNELLNVNVYDVTQGTKIETTTTYSIPDSVTVDTNAFISDTDSNGNTQKEKFGDVPTYETINWDEKTLYYNVDENGNKTPIYTHDPNLGVEQIKSKNDHIIVNSWKEVANADTRGNVRDVTHGSYQFYFYTNCEDSMSGFKPLYNADDVIPNSTRRVSEETTFDESTNTTTTTTIYERIYVRDSFKQKRGKKRVFLFTVYYEYAYYYPEVQYRRVQTIQKSGSSSTSKSTHSVKVNKGSKIKPLDLGLDNYHQYGFYSDEACTTFFDFDAPISSETNIYLKHLENNDASSLSNSINSMTSGNTLNVYNQADGGSGGSSGTNYDIFGDPYYNKNNKVCFINQTNVSSGATLNLLYGNGLVYETPNTGTINSSLGNHRSSTNTTINNLYNGSTYVGFDLCSTYIALGGDLTINGTVNIGGKIGSNAVGASVSKSSYLIGNYACIDLYGHNIYVDGGYLNCLGLIIDSVGTGQIIVSNGGKMTGVASITDNRAIRSSLLAMSKRQSLFTEYRFPYIQVPVRFYNGTSFEAYLKFDLTDDLSSIGNFYFNIVGNSNTLFKRADSDINSYMDFIPYFLENIKSTNLVANLYNLRNKLVFCANINQSLDVSLNMTISLTLGSATASIDFARIDFPISPFLDFVIKSGYYFKIQSKMTFYPGSTLLVEKGAHLKFTYYGEKTYKTMSGIPVPGETRYLAGGLMNYTNRISDLALNGPSNERFSFGIYNDTSYWSYNKFGNILILGDIEFDTSVNTSYSNGDGYYLISGYIDLSKEALLNVINYKDYIRTYDFKAELNNGYLFSGTDTSANKQYLRATSYNMNPLISNGYAYVIDKNKQFRGIYREGVIEETYNISTLGNDFSKSYNGKKYFLYADQDMYEGGSTGSNQSSRIDRTIEIREAVWHDYDRKIINSSGIYYCYYKGIYVPSNDDLSLVSITTNVTTISVNLRKFMSNSDVQEGSGYETKNIKFSTNGNWVFVS